MQNGFRSEAPVLIGSTITYITKVLENISMDVKRDGVKFRAASSVQKSTYRFGTGKGLERRERNDKEKFVVSSFDITYASEYFR